MTCWDLVTKGYASFDWGDSKTRYNSHTPYSATGPFFAGFCASMLVSYMASLIYTNIFRELRDASDSDNNNKKMPLTMIMTTTRRQLQQQQDAADNKTPNDNDTYDKKPTTKATMRRRRR